MSHAKKEWARPEVRKLSLPAAERERLFGKTAKSSERSDEKGE